MVTGNHQKSAGTGAAAGAILRTVIADGAWLESLEELGVESQEIAKQSLEERYTVSRIKSVEHSFVNHGHRYLKVMTNRGFRYFNLKEPGKNVTWLSDDKLIIRDSMGNRYEVESIAGLDSASREKLNLVL